MSAATESFLDQLEAAATPAVIGTKKAAKALAPSDIKTSQQDRLADMGTYKRRQKKMEKGLLNQEVEKDLPGLGPSKKAVKTSKQVGKLYTGAKVKEESPKIDGALSELATLFQGITGQEPEPEEPKALEPIPIPEPIVPYIDPRVIEEATNQLQALFSDISGVELFGERLEEEEVIEIPITPLKTFDISEVSSVTHQIFGGHNSNVLDTTLYDPTNYKHTKVIQDVDALLEKHKEALPETEYKILKTDAADKTAAYIKKLNLGEVSDRNSMPFTGSNSPLVTSGEFAVAVTGILRKMMATGPGSGVVEVSKLDDIDHDNKEVGYVLAYQPNTAPTDFPYKWQSPLTPPAGDINEVIAGDGLTGGGTSGAVELDAVGTANRITVSADAIDIATTYVGQNTITTLGTITTGVWNGNDITNTYLSTGINANKLADGSVTNAEFKYINSLTSNAQTQIDSKASTATVTAMAIALG